MNKITLRAIFFLLLMSSSFWLFAEYENTVELRSAAFIPTDNLFRDIYGNAGASYQLEASSAVYEGLDVWGNLDLFSKPGRSVGLGNSTEILIANTSVGIKVPFQFSEKISPYIGIGISLGRVWLKNNSFCGEDKASKFAVGGVLKTGINYFFMENVFLDVFIDYLYQPVHFETDIDIGGLKTGIGLGIQF